MNLAPVSAMRAAPTQPSRFRTPTVTPLRDLREAAANALFPFLVDTWLHEQRSFFQQFAFLMRAGLPLYQSLGSLQQNARGARLRPVLADALRTVGEGGRLSDSFARFPEVFSELHLALIRAGEEGGQLDRTFERITGHIEKEIELRRVIGKQTLYSKIVLVFGVLIIPLVFGLVFGGDVVGLLLRVFESVLELALLTALVFCVGRSWLARSARAREAYELAKWRLPGIGPVSRTFALARFGHALSGLYEAGVPLAGAVRIGGRASASFRVGEMAEGAALAAERGESTVPAMRSAGFLPENLLNMIETGVTTGELDVMLARAAGCLEAEAETKAHKAGYVFSTVLYLFVAFYVVNNATGGMIALLLPWRG